MIRSLTLLLAAAASLALSDTAAAAADAAARGKETFMRAGCYACHGTVAQGGSAGPKLAPEPMALAALRAYIRAPAGQMPPYREPSISDADIADIHAYLLTIGAPPRVQDTILGAN
jgi:ubiquinol-cytochrome c reductase cytochrome c subunit